ncbi:hypothetical protein [Xanthomonas citri]|uniref:hypothetical protein n=1 Tax=Xanthomonas citri TaxID=346 RepID=UPI001E3343B0|nr:hypothetical protein [Xanthomonas citri]
MKYSKVLSGLCVVMTWAISLPAFGEGTTLGEISQAAQRSGDKSRQALVAMYGNVVNNPLATGSAGGGDTILASLFQVTNGALLVIGAIFTCYMMFLKVSQTAHDGAVFDRAKKHDVGADSDRLGPCVPRADREWLVTLAVTDAVGCVCDGRGCGKHGRRCRCLGV